MNMNTQQILPLENKNNNQTNKKDEYNPIKCDSIQYYKSRSDNEYGQHKFK
jgi:hypothetical protein